MMCENLVKRLNAYSAEHEHHGGITAEAADAIEKLIEIIQNHDFLESLVKPDWIPMTERPPEEELAFYQCCTDAGMVIQCLWTNNRTGLGPLGEWGWRFTDVPSHQKVTHWMPLPPLPKEEE